MPFSVSVKNDFEKFASGYLDGQQKQVRYAARIALNNVAKGAVEDIKGRLPKIFDRPTPATVNAQFVRYATADNLVATVEIKDFTGKGSAPADWLSAEILGGQRDHKRSEVALIASGIMQPDQFWTPGQGLETSLNAYGNVPASRVVQALSRVAAFGEQGYAANASEKTKKMLARRKLAARGGKSGTDYFLWRDADGRVKAIMQVLGKGDVEPILFFTDRTPIYSKRFQFNDMVLNYVETHIGVEMAKSLELAFGTAR